MQSQVEAEPGERSRYPGYQGRPLVTGPPQIATLLDILVLEMHTYLFCYDTCALGYASQGGADPGARSKVFRRAGQPVVSMPSEDTPMQDVLLINLASMTLLCP